MTLLEWLKESPEHRPVLLADGDQLRCELRGDTLLWIGRGVDPNTATAAALENMERTRKELP